MENVGREFSGNYSCKGFNSAGWGEESKVEFLDVFYEPGNATISVTPDVPIKSKSMTLTCSIDEPGNPPASYRWFRGGKRVFNAPPVWTIDPVTLKSRQRFSCYALNVAGRGESTSVNIDVHAAPAFIQKLQQYTGVLFSAPKIPLSCWVECYPSCVISWFKNGIEIVDDNPKYFKTEAHKPANPSIGDFESVRSELVSLMVNRSD